VARNKRSQPKVTRPSNPRGKGYKVKVTRQSYFGVSVRMPKQIPSSSYLRGAK
jgi:hypothetical protein